MRWIGRTMLGIAALHTLFGVVFFRETLMTIVREGLVATIDAQYDRGAVFWFLYTGFLLALLGAWMNEREAEGRRFPGYLLVSLAILTGGGVLIMPRSGFWLLIPPVLGAIARNRRMGAAGPGIISPPISPPERSAARTLRPSDGRRVSPSP